MAYNSSHTGAQIDAAVGEVIEKANTWDGKQDALKGTKGQYVVFTANNVVGAANAPSGGSTSVAVVAYTGTNTFGANNSCSISANFVIKAAIWLGTNEAVFTPSNPGAANTVMLASLLSTSFQSGLGFSNNYTRYPCNGAKSADGKTFKWYTSHASAQLNTRNTTYYFLLMG